MNTFAIKSGYAWIDNTWLPNAYLTIQNGIITQISTTKPITLPLVDASDALLLPGFVNAHCHLELTALGPLSEHQFLPWIAQLMAGKKSLSPSAISQGIKNGAQRLLRSGVTTVIDHISQETPHNAFDKLPLKLIGFGEVIGVNPELAKNSLATWEKQNHFALTPHSIHAVHPKVLKDIFTKHKPPYSIHLAEAEIERAYFADQTGDMWNFIQSRGGEKHQATSAVQWIKTQRFLAPSGLLVHGNYFDAGDLATISKWTKSCIVHCPGSHAFFYHQEFPYEKIVDENISIALGTDSLASNTDLNLGHEIDLFCKKYSGQDIQSIMPLITTNALRALSITDRGELTVGQKADMSFWKNVNAEQALDAIRGALAPDSVMIDGVIVRE